jgi:hypothetical protein
MCFVIKLLCYDYELYKYDQEGTITAGEHCCINITSSWFQLGGGGVRGELSRCPANMTDTMGQGHHKWGVSWLHFTLVHLLGGGGGRRAKKKADVRIIKAVNHCGSNILFTDRSDKGKAFLKSLLLSRNTEVLNHIIHTNWQW